MSSSILVVEDDLNMQELIVEFLEDEGYLARGVDCSEEALSLASRIQFDLVVTDVRMAGVDGVDGFALLKKIHPNLKCIVMTGYTDLDAPARAIKIQIDDYIQKPFELDNLLTVVDRVLHSGSLAAYYCNIIEKAPAKLFAAALRFFRKDRFQALDNSRQKVFQGYFMAIRSNLIPLNSANGVFSRLLVLDQEYKESLGATTQETAARLQDKYDKLFDFLTALARSKTQMLGGDRIPASKFRPIYNAVKRGEITPEQLQLAPTLRQIDPEELAASPELRELQQQLWDN